MNGEIRGRQDQRKVGTSRDTDYEAVAVAQCQLPERKRTPGSKVIPIDAASHAALGAACEAARMAGEDLRANVRGANAARLVERVRALAQLYRDAAGMYLSVVTPDADRYVNTVVLAVSENPIGLQIAKTKVWTSNLRKNQGIYKRKPDKL